MNIYKNTEIETIIIETIESKIALDTSIENYKTSHFFGPKLNLHARELIWLIFTIQNKFSITINENDILDNDCYSIADLASLVQRKLTPSST